MQTKFFEGLPIRLFPTKASWAKWLIKWHEHSDGLWVRLAKRKSSFVTLSHKEAVEIALSFGWYTDRRLPESEFTWLERFVPRPATAMWTEREMSLASRLVELGAMMPAGLRSIGAARDNRHWKDLNEVRTTENFKNSTDVTDNSDHPPIRVADFTDQ